MLLRTFSLLVIVMTSCFVQAQDMDELMEKARAKALEIEKMKKALVEEPDSNVRLAAFELMVKSADPTMIDVAIDAGLASADSLLQAAAFKAAIFNLESIHLQLEVATDADEDKKSQARAYLKENGTEYIILTTKKDAATGTFSGSNTKGEIIGTHLTYTKNYDKGTLTLEDDARIVGKITLYSREYLEFMVSGLVH